MLKVGYKNEVTNFPFKQGGLVGSFGLDQDWRDRHYAEGGSSLNLALSADFHVPELDEGDLLYQYSAMELEPDRLLRLDIEISHTDFDFDRECSLPIGNLSLFPTLQEMAGLSLSTSILSETLLWFPVTGSKAEIQEFRFGRTHSGTIDCTLVARSRECTIEISALSIPYSVAIEIRPAPGTWVGFDNQAKFEEIEACYCSLYGGPSGQVHRRVLDPASGDVVVTFM